MAVLPKLMLQLLLVVVLVLLSSMLLVVVVARLCTTLLTPTPGATASRVGSVAGAAVARIFEDAAAGSATATTSQPLIALTLSLDKLSE